MREDERESRLADTGDPAQSCENDSRFGIQRPEFC